MSYADGLRKYLMKKKVLESAAKRFKNNNNIISQTGRGVMWVRLCSKNSE